MSGDWGKLGIPDFVGMPLMKSYLMLQNVKFTAFTVFELLKENQQGVNILSTILGLMMVHETT